MRFNSMAVFYILCENFCNTVAITKFDCIKQKVTTNSLRTKLFCIYFWVCKNWGESKKEEASFPYFPSPIPRVTCYY